MTVGEKPPFGVVIPAYGHPKFLAEAIISACEQQADRNVRVVVVDDGCKFPETGETVSQLQTRYPGILFYARQKNTRLPGARNTGIRFLLNLIPEIEAIYLLDADNRLSKNSLMVFWEALGDDPKVGWAYPDISFFGLTRGEDGFDTRETAPSYSPLKHLVGNISEAGSMVRADVFRAGVMYDESMTSGFEDWEYWLSALDAGYVGVRAVDTGFMYRGRPESMLADSKRLADGLVDKIRTKHKALYSPKNIMRLEQDEAPTFAFFVPEEERIYLASDLSGPYSWVSPDAFQTQFQAWARNPVEHFFPTHLFVVPQFVWEGLKNQKVYLRWLFWNIREQAAEKLTLLLRNTGKVGLTQLAACDDSEPAHIHGVRTSLLWRLAQGGADDEGGEYRLYLSLPLSHPIEPIDAAELRATLSSLTSDYCPLPISKKHASRSFAGPHSRTVREILIRDICAFEGREPFPACTDAPRTLVAFKAKLLASAPAMDKLRLLLETLKQQEGQETILLLEHDTDIENVYLRAGEAGWPSLLSSIVPYKLPGNELEYSIYLGKRYQRELTATAPDDIAILARPCDRVIACGAVAAVEALGAARQRGAAGSVFLAPEFLDKDTDQDMSLAKLLAFEHAVTLVATDDAGYRDALAGQGFPINKFVDEGSYLAQL